MTMINRKGFGTIGIILIILGFLVGTYIITFIPIPAFTSFRFTVNYWAILTFFFTLQVGIVYLFYKLARYSRKGYRDINHFIKNWHIKIRNYFTFRL